MPKELGKYLLLDRINHGGMADVYLAKDFGFEGADRIIAVKCIREDICEDPAFVEMFVDEAKLSVLLTHENIARTFELGSTDKSYYIAMEHVAGRDLRAVVDRIKHQGLELPEHLVLQVISEVLEGLDYAHRKTDLTGKALHIVHRDVSPQNVLISYAGDVKLIDFGIAKAATQASQSQGGVLKGKYGYMSPEQVMGASVDARSDIFATGVLLYELFTQERLFDGASDFSILEKVRHAEVYPPSVIVPQVSVEVEEIVLRALCQRPEDRFDSASDMLDAVVEVMLRRHGTPTARELSNLMHDLFEEEIAADQVLLERARETLQPPVGIESVGTPLSETPPTAREAAPAARAPVATPVERPSQGQGEDTHREPRSKSAASLSDELPDTSPELLVPPAPSEDAGDDEATTDPQAEVKPKEALANSPDTQPNIILHRITQMDVSRPDTDRIEGGVPPDQAADRSSSAQTSGADTLDSHLEDARPEPTSRVYLAPQPGRVKPTEVLKAYRPKISRDVLIVAAAVLIALGLVVGSWLATRGGATSEPGRVMILSVPPGASVFLDGAEVGRTPYGSSLLPAGRYTMVLKRPGYVTESRVIEVKAGIELPVHLILVEEKGDP